MAKNDVDRTAEGVHATAKASAEDILTKLE
jgi:hypothetical protein